MSTPALVRAGIAASVLALVGCSGDRTATGAVPFAVEPPPAPATTSAPATSLVTAVPVAPAATTAPRPSTTQPRPASPPTTSPPTTQVPTTEPMEPRWTRYESATYMVALRHPPSWPAPADGEAAPPYFFSLQAASSGGGTVAQACASAASHRLMPFGPSPAVYMEVEFAGQPACVIEPTGDPATARVSMAQVIVRYPKALVLPSGRYDLLVLTAQLSELAAIASTMTFVS